MAYFENILVFIEFCSSMGFISNGPFLHFVLETESSLDLVPIRYLTLTPFSRCGTDNEGRFNDRTHAHVKRI